MTPLLLDLTLIDLTVVAALAFVIPVALGRYHTAWWVTAASAGLALRCGRATVPAVVLALPWLGLAVEEGLHRLREVGLRPRRWGPPELASLAMVGYLLGAAAWFVLSRGGANPTGITEPIVELTAVHFSYVGLGALHLACVEAAHVRSEGRWPRAGTTAVLLTAGAPPVIAVGFATSTPVLQVVGAVLLTVGVWCTAGLELRRAARGRDPRWARIPLALSGLAIWIPMVLAVAWAAGQEWDVPALSIPDMARTHGAVNAVGFIGLGLVAAVLGPRRVEEGTPWS